MGLIDMLGDAQVRNLSDAWMHAAGNITVVVIELYNWYFALHAGVARRSCQTGLVLSLIVVLILLFMGLERLGDGVSPSRGCSRHTPLDRR